MSGPLLEISAGELFRQYWKCPLQDTSRRRELLDELNSKSRKKGSTSPENLINRLEKLPLEFLKSLDELIPFKGLWDAVLIGTFGRIANLHMPEELTRCLKWIKIIWTWIMGPNSEDWVLLDPTTVAHLQGRNPGLSFADRAYVNFGMDSHELFSAIEDEDRRSKIKGRLCSLNHVIQSLSMFIENTKYLELGSKSLGEILPKGGTKNIAKSFRKLHNGKRECIIQTSVFKSYNHISSSLTACWISYRVLWLIALRHFPGMRGIPPRMNCKKLKPRQYGLEKQWWVDLCSFAIQNGYDGICQKYSDREEASISMINDCATLINPPEYHKKPLPGEPELCYEILASKGNKEEAINVPQITTNDKPEYFNEIKEKCGRPLEIHYKTNKSHLFFDNIFTKTYDMKPKRYITSFGFTRDFLIAFFGLESSLDIQMGALATNIVTELEQHKGQSEARAPVVSQKAQEMLLIRSEAANEETEQRSSLPLKNQQISLETAMDYFHDSQQCNEIKIISFMPPKNFQVRKVAKKRSALVDALDFESQTAYLTVNGNKRLKLTAKTDIVNGAVKQRLDAAFETSLVNKGELVACYDQELDRRACAGGE